MKIFRHIIDKFNALCTAQLKRTIPWVVLVTATFVFVKDGMSAGTTPWENFLAYALCVWIGYSPQWGLHIIDAWKGNTITRTVENVKSKIDNPGA